MSWAVEMTAPARRDLRRLDRQTAARISAAIIRLAESEQGDVKRLTGLGPFWRLRVGDWRVLFVYEFDVQSISVERVLPRGRAYRD